VEWSYNLLDETERMVLARCSVFAGGFDLATAARLCETGDELVRALRDRGNPVFYYYGLAGYGRAFIDTDPERALAAFREGLDYTRQHRLPLIEVVTAYTAAGIVARYGDLDTALGLFDSALETVHRAGVDTDRALTLGYLAMLFCRINQAEAAATIYGASTRSPSIGMVRSLPQAVEQLQISLGQLTFQQRVAAGAAMEPADAVAYARQHIRLARDKAQQE
jgi:hypothetical protein